MRKSAALLTLISAGGLAFAPLPAQATTKALSKTQCSLLHKDVCIKLTYVDYGNRMYVTGATAVGKATANGSVRADIAVDGDIWYQGPYVTVHKGDALSFKFATSVTLYRNEYMCVVWEGVGTPIGSPCIAYPPTFNDSIHNAVTVAATPFAYTESTYAATRDDVYGEPNPSCGDGSMQANVWFRYSPTRTGYYTFSTAGSTYDTELSVWNGSKQVGCNDDYSGGTSQLYLYLTKGKAYQIAVDGFNGQMGQLRFSVS